MEWLRISRWWNRKGETPEEATKREAFEELGVTINVKDCLEIVQYNGIQYYFLAELIEGIIGTGQGEEFTDTTRNGGSYQPMWVDISDLLSINVRPIEVAYKIYILYLKKHNRNKSAYLWLLRFSKTIYSSHKERSKA